MQIDNSTPLVFVDLETTGTSARLHRVIEIGIVRVEHGKEAARYRSFVNPGVPVPSMITSLTGITSAMLVDAPTFDEVALEVAEFLEGGLFIAHNAIFDYSFLGEEFRRLGIRFSYPYLCSARLSRLLYPEHRRHNLDSLIERYDLDAGSRHRAFDDAFVLWQFLQRAHDMHGMPRVHEAMQELTKLRTLPLHIQEKDITKLPDSPGVYFFYGKDNELLYVGKSRKIRTRVRSHFTADARSSQGQDMLREVRRIEAQETAGELGALLLESHLIKTREPAYNKLERKKKEIFLARETLTSDGYASLSLGYAEGINQEVRGEVVGVYKSREQARESLADLARTHGLCTKLLGIEGRVTAPGSCFAHGLGACQGACVGREKSRTYNRRFREAFESQRIQSWPFGGPVAIEEKTSENSGELFVIDNWILIAAVRFSEGEWEEFVPVSYRFEYDAYKIFARELVKKKSRFTIRDLTQREAALLTHDDVVDIE